MKHPKPREIQFARSNAGLSQEQAALLVHLAAPIRWSEYERGVRNIDLARWELFLIKTGQHPTSSTINGMLVMPVFT
jgi:hypothetical protein